MLSVELPSNVGDAWDEVDRTSSYKQGWLSREDSTSCLVNLVRSDLVDFITILMEGEVSKCLEVTCDLLKALLLVFHSKEYIHFENVLCSCQFLVWNWFTEFV